MKYGGRLYSVGIRKYLFQIDLKLAKTHANANINMHRELPNHCCTQLTRRVYSLYSLVDSSTATTRTKPITQYFTIILSTIEGVKNSCILPIGNGMFGIDPHIISARNFTVRHLALLFSHTCRPTSCSCMVSNPRK